MFLVLVKLSFGSFCILLTIVGFNVISILTVGGRGGEGRGGERWGGEERGGVRRGGEGREVGTTAIAGCAGTTSLLCEKVTGVLAHSKIFFKWYFLASAMSAEVAAPKASPAGGGEGRGGEGRR